MTAVIPSTPWLSCLDRDIDLVRRLSVCSPFDVERRSAADARVRTLGSLVVDRDPVLGDVSRRLVAITCCSISPGS